LQTQGKRITQIIKSKTEPMPSPEEDSTESTRSLSEEDKNDVKTDSEVKPKVSYQDRHCDESEKLECNEVPPASKPGVEENSQNDNNAKPTVDCDEEAGENE
jgi:hypothetical protein